MQTMLLLHFYSHGEGKWTPIMLKASGLEQNFSVRQDCHVSVFWRMQCRIYFNGKMFQKAHWKESYANNGTWEHLIGSRVLYFAWWLRTASWENDFIGCPWSDVFTSKSQVGSKDASIMRCFLIKQGHSVLERNFLMGSCENA